MTAPVERGRGMEDAEPARVPAETRCPSCGAEPSDDSVVKHRLANNGYLHDDVWLECASDDCEQTWTLGIPLGDPEPEFYDDLECGCGEFAITHRVQLVTDERVRLHVKCPRCYCFWMVDRVVDANNIALVGHPRITGDTTDAKPWGWERDRSDE